MTGIAVAEPAPESALSVEYCGEWYRLEPRRVFAIGRDADLDVDDNPFLHRRFLEISRQDGLWWLSNVGSRLAATVTDGGGRVQAWLAPGARLPIVFGRLNVIFTAGPTTYEFTVHSSEPPFAATPFVVTKGFAVSKSHSTPPLAVEYARRWPSTEPDKTYSGVAVTAPDCAGLQLLRLAHALEGGALHRNAPVATASACNPPPASGFGTKGCPSTGLKNAMSETATYTLLPSVAVPHCTPPSRPPLPTRVCHTIRPRSSGSSAHIIPDFCPIVSRRLPSVSVTRLAEVPRS